MAFTCGGHVLNPTEAVDLGTQPPKSGFLSYQYIINFKMLHTYCMKFNFTSICAALGTDVCSDYSEYLKTLNCRGPRVENLS